SSLYRSFLWPVLRSDVNGDFRDAAGKIQNKGFRYYTIPSLWDTYRNKVVLLGLLSPDVTTDVLKSLVERGKATGFIPTLYHGDHAAYLITRSYLRELTNVHIDTAHHLHLKNPPLKGGTRPYIKEYIKKGYLSTPAIAS